MSSQCLAITRKVAFLTLPESHFWLVLRAKIGLKVPCVLLKERFFELNKVAFRDCQEAENELKLTSEHMKHRFVDFTQVAFWARQ